MKKNDIAPSDAPEVLALLADENETTLTPENSHLFTFDDLSKGVRDFLASRGFAQKTYDRLVKLFGLVKEYPEMSVVDLCIKSGMKRPTYYLLMKNAAFSEQLDELRMKRIEKDTTDAYGILIKLMKNPDPNVAFKAAKMVLENNGAKYGFAKKDDNGGVLQIQIEDKRTDKTIYSDEELDNV